MVFSQTGIKVSGETTMQYCRNRGRIAVTLELNRAAFYPGDTMECCVQIENNSNRPTWNIQLSIIRVSTSAIELFTGIVLFYYTN